MMRALCLVLLLTACASPQRGEYRQGVPMAPGAPAFNPAWEAPHTVGQPGYIGAPESVPRSPHRRYLPPTKEPGLWAGDTKASATDGELGVVVAGFPIPLPSFDEDPSLNGLPAAECSQRIATALSTDDALRNERAKLLEPEKYCAAVMAFARCLSDLRTTTEDPSVLAGAAAAIQDAFALAQKVCRPPGTSARGNAFSARLAAAAKLAPTRGTAH